MKTNTKSSRPKSLISKAAVVSNLKVVNDILVEKEFLDFAEDFFDQVYDWNGKIDKEYLESFSKTLKFPNKYTSPPLWYDFPDHNTSTCRESARYAYVNCSEVFCVMAQKRDISLAEYLHKVESVLGVKNSKLIFDSSRNLIFSKNSLWLSNTFYFEIFTAIIKAYYKINFNFDSAQGFIDKLKEIGSANLPYYQSIVFLSLIKSVSKAKPYLMGEFLEFYDSNEEGLLSYIEENQLDSIVGEIVKNL